MIINTPFVVFSAALASLSPDMNAWRDRLLHTRLDAKGISFRPAIGAYNGIQEHSVLVPVRSEDDYAAVAEIAFEFQQESILYVDANSHASLDYLSGDIKPIGRWTQVSAHAALHMDGYTQVGNEYFRAA